MGEDKFSRFVQQLGPKLYARLAKKNVKNLNAAYRNAMLLLAYESDYGNSPVAKRLHNYGGYGWNGKTYTTFRDDDSFLDAYTNLVTSRYRDAINSANLRSFATNLKKKGYFEDDLDHYYGQLAGMTSMAKAIDSHMAQNPDIYSFASQPIPANLQYVHQPVSTRVATRPEYSYQLPELVVTGNRPKLTLPSISLSLELAMAKLLLSASGFNPDMPMWELYAPTYRPLVIPLHYEDGKEGQNADATWHENWLSGRLELLNENLSLRPLYKYMNSWDLQHQIERLKTTPEYSGSLSDGTYGITTNQTITYDDAQINKNAGVRVDLSPESVRVHERTHALQPLPQEDKIMRIGGNNTTENPYTDEPSEIYAGLMEQRYRLGLSPEYKVTLEDIKRWRNEKKLNMYLENKSDEILLRYFNEVAYNPTPRLNIPDIT